MASYRHLFFDLDHTLWDFERNSAEVLTELYDVFRLESLCRISSAGAFVETFSSINMQLWDAFHVGQIPHTDIRAKRFPLVFEALGAECPPFVHALSDAYLEFLPQKTHLLTGAKELLDYLMARGYMLHVITNGFDAIQAKKMKNSAIDGYFTHVVTHETADAKKPDPRIFAHALALTGDTKPNCLMIGDSWEADVQGALRFGLDAVFYNPEGTPIPGHVAPTYEISSLLELTNHL